MYRLRLSYSLAFIISLLITILLLIVLHHIQYYMHEYGHVLKLKETIYKYKKEIKSDKINIQVIKFTTFFGLLILKIKTYSDYSKILENNKQDTEYQNIIKDIAISGYNFSKQIIECKLFCILCSTIWLITLVFTMFSILYNNYVTTKFVLILLFFKVLTWIMYIIFSYFLLCESGYGPNRPSQKGRASDHYIYFHPNKFKYLIFEEDKAYLKKEYKIILYIEIDLSDRKNPKTNIISRNKFYNRLAKRFPLKD